MACRHIGLQSNTLLLPFVGAQFSDVLAGSQYMTLAIIEAGRHLNMFG